MSSARKEIRNRVIELLSAANIVPTGRLFRNRMRSLETAELPAMLVYTFDEPVVKHAESPKEYERRLSLSVEIVGTASEDLDDLLDDLADRVEKVINDNYDLGGLCRDIDLSNTESQYSDEGHKAAGAVRMTFIVTYYTLAVQDSSDLEDFESAVSNITAEASGATAEIDAKVELPVEET